MQINFTKINSCVWIQPTIFNDDRGIFCETFKQSFWDTFKPVQSNYSFSKAGVLRGIHRTPYAKLVTCVKGSVYDVCIDLRTDSETYGQHYGIILNHRKLNSLYIPPYCGHAFLSLEDSILIYQQDQEYDSKLDETYCHQQYDILWPNYATIISEKDKRACDETS